MKKEKQGKKGIIGTQDAALSDKAIDEKRGCYVYALVEPEPAKRIFYIGKGKNQRPSDHIREAISAARKEANLTDKQRKIIEILDARKKVQFVILRSGLTDHEAYELEGMMINFLNRSDYDFGGIAQLLNIQNGHHNDTNGIMNLGYMFGAPEAEVNDKEKIIAISINESYNLAKRNVYNAVRESWHVSLPHARRADYVVAVYHGIVLGIYNNVLWKYVPGSSPSRYCFEAEEVKTSNIYERLFHKEWPNEYKFGSGNPIRYTYK